jgi:hypothetical protein
MRLSGSLFFILCLGQVASSLADTNAAPLPRIEVSANHRFLVTADGAPFFYLGDTAWALFTRLNREDAAKYLETRGAQGFTVIQAALTFGRSNAYRKSAFVDNNSSRPAITPGRDPADPEQYDFWDHTDYIIEQAEHHGLYVGLLPVWGVARSGRSPAFSEASAEAYGTFLGARYKNRPIIWILGGDQSPEGNETTWRAMARGIAIGVSGKEDYSKTLITYHPYGYSSTSATWFHNEPWLDFNMQQNGHKRNWPVYDKIANDYNRVPPKPTMDAEPSYEWHPVDFDNAKGRINPHDVRTFAYWEVFAGACGFTYGHYLIFPFSGGGRDGGSNAGTGGGWLGALDAPAAQQMKHLKQLVLSRSYLDRIPDQQLFTDTFAVADHVSAARGRDYAFFYGPTGKAFSVRMGKISGAMVKAQWYDPREGTYTAIGEFPNSGTRRFTPPTSGAENDWVLVLDDIARR